MSSDDQVLNAIEKLAGPGTYAVVPWVDWVRVAAAAGRSALANMMILPITIEPPEENHDAG